MDFVAEIENAVRQLKVERDTWQAVASQYKAAFETQTTRLQELQDVCIAAQAELENERVQRHRLDAFSVVSEKHQTDTFDRTFDPRYIIPYGTAAVCSPRKRGLDGQYRLSDEWTNPLFEQATHYLNQGNHGTALAEVERLLRGPLSAKARAEGLLLKSDILRATGPEELLDALAACSEAMDLCDRLSDLETFLPRIQYQRGLLYYELRMVREAREAFSEAGNDEVLRAKASAYRISCDDELRVAKRRSGFDENRTINEELLANFDVKEVDVSLGHTIIQPIDNILTNAETVHCRISTQLRHRVATKTKRISLPKRWMLTNSV